MMSVEEIRNKLQGMNIKKVARDTSLHFNTIYSIANGKKKNPSYNVVLKLSEYLSSASA
jgi:transcriptional regulator with XRE-family HTH domain